MLQLFFNKTFDNQQKLKKDDNMLEPKGVSCLFSIFDYFHL